MLQDISAKHFEENKMITEAKEQLQKDLAKLKAKQDGDGKIMERIDGLERDLREAKELNDKLESETKTFASENKVLVFFKQSCPLIFTCSLQLLLEKSQKERERIERDNEDLKRELSKLKEKQMETMAEGDKKLQKERDDLFAEVKAMKRKLEVTEEANKNLAAESKKYKEDLQVSEIGTGWMERIVLQLFFSTQLKTLPN